MKTIGVIGGLGPMATVYYLEMVTKMTDASKDQQHPRIVLQSIPDTPDRTDYIIGKSKENPLPHLLRAGKQLQQMGADFIAIPCVTAQYFYEEIERELEVPVISLCGDIAEDMAEKKISSVGLLATSGTIESKVLETKFLEKGIQVHVPKAEDQRKVMELIYHQIKEGKPVDWENFYQVSDSLLQKAERLILGCTELSLLKKERELPSYYVDVLQVLAQKTLLAAEVPILPQYKDLIR